MKRNQMPWFWAAACLLALAVLGWQTARTLESEGEFTANAADSAGTIASQSLYTLDRIEGEVAVLLSRKHGRELLILAESLPGMAEEGDILRVVSAGDDEKKEIVIDWVETRKIRNRIKELLRSLREQQTAGP